MRGASLLWFVAIAFAEQATWQRHAQEGDRLAEAGRYRYARDAYQLALCAEDTPSDPGLRAARWNDLALMNRYLGNLAEGREQYRLALASMEKAHGAGSPAYAAVLHNLAAL